MKLVILPGEIALGKGCYYLVGKAHNRRGSETMMEMAVALAISTVRKPRQHPINLGSRSQSLAFNRAHNPLADNTIRAEYICWEY